MNLNTIRFAIWETMELGKLIYPLLVERNELLRVIDGGAGSGPLPCDAWGNIPSNALVSYGFDLDRAEAEKMRKLALTAGRQNHYYGALLGVKTGIQTFYCTANPGGASLYPPNMPLVNRLRYTDGAKLSDHLRVEKTAEAQCTTIDDWRKSDSVLPIDFIKLNVQGAELPILEGSPETLKETLGLQLEASFGTTYSGQPVFADLDAFLRRQGFVFFDFLAPNLVGRAISPVTVNVPQIAGAFRFPSRQIFEGHFLWLRDPIANDLNMSETKVLKLVCIAEMYGQVEYAFELLVWLKNRYEAEQNLKQATAINEILQKAAMRYNGFSLKRILKQIVKGIGWRIFPDRPMFRR